jgi:YspA, cpYpsA-related SLOG family
MADYRILVTGSRHWTDRCTIHRALLRATVGVDPARIVVVHGAAPGADSLAEQIVRSYGWRIEPHPANWPSHGRSAGFRRNAAMVQLGADVVLAFAQHWDSGTGHCARLARDAGIHTEDWGVDTRAARHKSGLRDGHGGLFGAAS